MLFAGSLFTATQTLYVRRGSKGDTSARIKDRVKMIESNPNMPKLIIFPEGTVSNGTAI